MFVCAIWGFVLILLTVHHLGLEERTNCWGPSASPNSAELCSNCLIFPYFNKTP